MKVLKQSGQYLKKSSERYAVALVILFLFGLPVVLFLFFTGGFLAWVLLVFILMIIGGYLLYNWSSYHQGYRGEELVTRVLSCLDDRYYLINDVKFSDGYGNIDHIVLGPNGVFVIETKNYVGQIICYGDEWSKRYVGRRTSTYPLKSPSKQAKRNATRIKCLIDTIQSLKPLNIWVDALLVFVNPNVNLHINSPTVPVLKIDELCNYIRNKKSKIIFSPQELESIGNVILNHAR